MAAEVWKADRCMFFGDPVLSHFKWNIIRWGIIIGEEKIALSISPDSQQVMYW
jgi:hypothetical protein